jgi:hypothetical protein
MKKLINFVLSGIMFSITVVTFLFSFSKTEVLRSVFIGGSIVSTTEIFSANYFIVLALYIAALISLVLYFKKIKFSIFYFIIFTFIWLLSGRVLGVHYIGELTVGWFFIKTEKIILWKQNECIADVLNYTNFNKEFPFMLQYSNPCIEGKTYLGPVIISEVFTYVNNLK